MAVEKRDLILPRIEPCEVAARVHQPHDKHPRLAPLTRDVDEHLKEIHLAEVARLVHERHKHLHAPPLPLGDHLAHDAVRDGETLSDEHLVQPRRREPLLAGSPSRRLTEELLHARPHALLDRAHPRHRRAYARRGALDVPPNGVTRHAQLARHPPDRELLDENLVPNYVDLIHPQHPPAEPPGHRPSQLSRLRGGSVSGRRLDQFHSAAITILDEKQC